MKQEFHVEGMMCTHCENRVEKALSQISGIHTCKADATAKNVICEYDETLIDVNGIKDAILDTGYDVVE